MTRTDIGSSSSVNVKDTMSLRTVQIKRRPLVIKREGMCRVGLCELYVGGKRMSESFSGECWVCVMDSGIGKAPTEDDVTAVIVMT